MRTKRRLALVVLLAAAGIAVLAYPLRATWWGGLALAMAEAGIVGGLADWFAVTAIFRRPLGLPIPHTALIPANWELLARRMGTMVGERVLTRAYLTREIGRIDVAELLARGAERIRRDDIEHATRGALRWIAAELPPPAAGELVGRLQRILLAPPLAPLLAGLLDIAREQGWDRRALGAVAAALVESLERPELRAAAGEVVDDVLARYRERVGGYRALALDLAGMFGLVDRDRIVQALHRGLRDVAADAEHPLRRRLLESLAEFAARLRSDAALAARVEAVKAEILGSASAARLADDALTALRSALLADLAAPRSEAAAWVAERLERARVAIVADAGLRAEVSAWTKARAIDLVERHHGRIAAFIEQGVRALGPAGAVALVEEHAGDDLQYIRVNGTVVGGLAGGALYGLHRLLRFF